MRPYVITNGRTIALPFVILAEILCLYSGLWILALLFWFVAAELVRSGPVVFKVHCFMKPDLHLIAVEAPDDGVKTLGLTPLKKSLLGRIATVYLVDRARLVNMAAFERAAEFHFLKNVCETPQLVDMTDTVRDMAEDMEMSIMFDDGDMPVFYAAVPWSFRREDDWLSKTPKTHRIALPATSAQAAHFETYEAFFAAALEAVKDAVGTGELTLDPFCPEINSEPESPEWLGLINLDRHFYVVLDDEGREVRRPLHSLQ